MSGNPFPPKMPDKTVFTGIIHGCTTCGPQGKHLLRSVILIISVIQFGNNGVTFNSIPHISINVNTNAALSRVLTNFMTHFWVEVDKPSTT
jgi:hypothetical protein